MVYRGRPSTGCKRCRERKVKVSTHASLYIYPHVRFDYWKWSTACRVPRLLQRMSEESAGAVLPQLGINCEHIT
jgi:hypothetical protein